MLNRTIGSIFRGRATPLHIMTGCVLGGVLGFMPGFSQAAGPIVLVGLLLLLLQTSIGMALLVALLAKLVSWLVLPFTFMVGTLLLDGPLQGFFKSMINAPVLALFGFEYYVTTGGLLVGAVFGAGLGLLLVLAVNAFRRKMSALEENSERFNRYTSTPWAKALLWLFVGSGHGKKTYKDLLARRWGNPVRLWGAAVAAVVVAILVIGHSFLSGRMITSAIRNVAEKANGATVDLDNVDINLVAGDLTITGLAMADPEQLDTDLFRAATIRAKLSTSNLLRKRLQIDQILVSGASTGEKRAKPGVLVGSPPPPLPPEPEGKSLEDYLAQADKWKERLTQVRRWLEKLSGPKKDQDAPQEETLKDRLDRLIAEDGYTRVRADHLIEGAPAFMLLQLKAEKVHVAQLPGETLDISANSLSTHPHLVVDPPQVSIASSAKTLDFYADLAASAAPVAKATGQLKQRANRLRLILTGLSGDAVGKMLSVGGTPPIKGGTVDLPLKGTWTAGRVNFKPTAVVHNAQLFGAGASATVQKLELPLEIKGPLDSPRIIIDQKKLGDALAAAGAGEIKNRLEAEAAKALGKITGGSPIKIPTSLPGKPEDLIDNLGGLLGPASRPNRK